MYWRVMLRINFLLLVVIFILAFGWVNAAREIWVNIPPDLSSGAKLKPGNNPEHIVYDFALNIFQQLQRWKKSGDKDYTENIAKYASYLTPQYVAFLKRDYERRRQKGELTNRERTVQQLPGVLYDSKRVQKYGDHSWVVFLDLELNETYQGEEIKHLYIRYPVMVKTYDVDRQLNPWGLALDGYYTDPEKITESGELKDKES